MHPLSQKIASLQHRLLWRERLVAACKIAAAVIAVGLVLGSIDYVVQYADPGLRIMATLALVAAAAWAVYRWWYVPGRRRLVPLTVARQVEARFPQLRDSLASAVEFLQQSEDDRTAGSSQLRRLVVNEAQLAVDGLPLDEVIDRRPLRRAAGWLGGAVVLVVVGLAWDARAVGTAVLRLAAPLGSTEWPRNHHLAFRSVPSRLAAGQTFEVELIDTAGSLPDDVRIEYREATSGGSQSTSEPMTPAGDMMIARREDVRQSFAFRAEGGDDHTMPWHWVEVVEPPRLESLEIVVHPPRYTGLPAATAERHLQVLAGTAIEVRGMASEPVSAARIVLEGEAPIVADVGSNKTGARRGSFHLGPGKWIATKSGPYRLELADAEGLAGIVGQWNLRVQEDSPPSVSWQRPGDNLYVTATAVVPIEVTVKDDLAIERVELKYERSDRSESERARQPNEARIELYRRPQHATSPAANTSAGRAETRMIEYSWDLAPLQLPIGAQLVAHVDATDYRPATGRTIGPRRITVITADELEARLADRQTQIVRQLERALAAQQTTREDVRPLEIRQREAGALTGGDRNAIQTAELNQHRVGRTLVDPVEGVPALVAALLDEIEINRVPATELRASMDRLTDELQRLASERLSVADRELTASRKLMEGIAGSGGNDGDQSFAMDEPAAQRLSGSLSAAGAAQDEVIATLERLIADLSGRADYRRLAQQLAELREDQLAHEKVARADIGLDTLPLQPGELTRAQRAKLSAAAAGEQALAARFGKIQQAMDRLAQQLAGEEAEDAGRLAEAVALSRRLAIDTDMQEAVRDLAENRVGQALAREGEVAEELQQVVDVLRQQGEQRPEQLVEKLREAEQRLAALSRELAALKDEIAQSEKQAASADAQQTGQLHQQQQALQAKIEELSRQLERLQAVDAGRSTRSAANRLGQRSPGGNQNAADAKRPSPSSEVQKAEQDLAEAARQLAKHRQQAEDDLALEFVRRFQAELAEMVARQKRVIEGTLAIDSQRSPTGLSNEATAAVAKLADEERRLAEMAREHGEVLSGLGAVRVSLEEAERRLAAAARRLDERDTAVATQRAERHALERLEGMMQAFAQTASEAAPQNQAPPPNAGAPAGQPPERRPTFELLEVKMLRMLQADLNERTREFDERLAALDAPPSDRQRAELTREARELKAEQGRLAELVQNMLTRDNEEGQE